MKPFYVKAKNRSDNKERAYMLKDKEYLCLGIFQMDVSGILKLLVVGEDRELLFLRTHDVYFERLAEDDVKEINENIPPEVIKPTPAFKGKK